MMNNKRKETAKKLADEVHQTFHTAEVNIGVRNRVDVKLRKDLVLPFLNHAKTYLGFDHLAHMSVVDWLEEKEFELVWILWSYDLGIQLFTRTRIPRQNAKFVSSQQIWRQAHTYEREMHEMYGIVYEGHDQLDEFILEDWDGPPPMRRDFDTVAYVNNTFLWREGREDAQDVRLVIAKNNETPVPDIPINKTRKQK